MVYECIFGWSYVMYHFWVTVTLTSYLVFRIIVKGAYLLKLFALGILNLVFGCIFGWQSVMYQVLAHCGLDLFSRIIMP